MAHASRLGQNEAGVVFRFVNVNRISLCTNENPIFVFFNPTYYWVSTRFPPHYSVIVPCYCHVLVMYLVSFQRMITEARDLQDDETDFVNELEENSEPFEDLKYSGDL